MLELNFLGKVRIKLDDQDISSKVSSKSAALLAVLLLQKHKKIDRDKLAGYLWPESAEDAAKYNLRYNLWQLKKLLYSAVQEESFLIVTKTTWPGQRAVPLPLRPLRGTAYRYCC